ncbi:MAG: general secretion pathway protein GspL [Desulfuromonadales bacterium]|nr:general secretion pathway protein GspL [Desulfuromonadales bacterium]
MDYLIIRIDENNVTVARFGVSGRSVALEGSAQFELNGEQDLAAAAARIASGISGSPRVVLCLPPSLFAHRIVELPLTDLRKVREVLPAHLQGEFALPVETVVFDALQLPEGKFLALWARRADISQAIDLFKQAGLEPAIVSSEPFSWPHLPGIPADCALCDGNALAIVAAGRLAFVRALPVAERQKQLLATLSALEMSEMALPSKLIIFGVQSGSAQAVDTLPLAVETLELPKELAVQFRSEQTFQLLAGMYAVALSIRAGSLPDFRRGNLAWTAGDALLRKKLGLTALLAVLALLLLFIGKCLQYQSANRDIVSLNSSISSMYREIFPTRTKAVDEVAEIKGEIRKLTGSDSAGGVLDTLKQLADTKGAGVNGLYEAELEGRNLRLKGDARSAQAVNEFKTALASLMSAVEVGELKSRPDGGVTFTLVATLREGKK